VTVSELDVLAEFVELVEPDVPVATLSAMCVSFVGRLARSVSAVPGTVLRDAWAVS